MKILTELITRHLDNDRFVQLTEAFVYESDLLAKWGFDPRVEIPVSFVQDFESLPIVRGRNKRGGTVHDYFSCYDSSPVVSQWQAADLYAEMNAYTDSIDHGRDITTQVYDWLRRNAKSTVVRFWPFFFHKRSVFATCKEIAGIESDPYVTIEKIEAAIVKVKQVQVDLKDANILETGFLLAQTDKMISDLEEMKIDVEERLA